MTPTLRRFQPLRPAEAEYVFKLRARLWNNERFVILGDGLRPEASDPTRTLRADFVRFLALGGGADLTMPRSGLRLRGAAIEGELTLEACRGLGDVQLTDCLFDSAPVLRGAEINLLILSRSHLPGLKADRLETHGGVFLRRSVFTGEVRLLGARVTGDLACQEARFSKGEDPAEGQPETYALACDGVEIDGTVFLNAAFSQGETRFAYARIGRNLSLDGAGFNNPRGVALRLEGMELTGTLFQRPLPVKGRAPIDVRFGGVLELTSSCIGSINDRRSSWPRLRGLLRLDRCVYGAFTGGGTPVGADDRLAWLDLQNPRTIGAEFQPQSYEQLAKVLLETGHAEDARRVLIAKEALQRRARRERAATWLKPVLWLRDQLLRITVRYGRAPTLAFAWLLGLWLLGAGLFADAAAVGAMKPNNPFILRSPEWALCVLPARPEVFADAAAFAVRGRAAPDETQADCFARQVEATSFPRLDVWAYSADTLFPLVDLGMQEHWIPDEGHPWRFAAATRAYLWIHVALGWALSLLAVAGFSGIAKSD